MILALLCIGTSFKLIVKLHSIFTFFTWMLNYPQKADNVFCLNADKNGISSSIECATLRNA